MFNNKNNIRKKSYIRQVFDELTYLEELSSERELSCFEKIRLSVLKSEYSRYVENCFRTQKVTIPNLNEIENRRGLFFNRQRAITNAGFVQWREI